MKDSYVMFGQSPYLTKQITLEKEKNGFPFSPKNQIAYDGIDVNTLVLMNPFFIKKVLMKKIKKRLDLYLQYIIRLLDSGDTGSENPSDLRSALNDLQRYRYIVYNNYQKYLDQKYIDLLFKKIALLEHELKMKLIYMEQHDHTLKEQESKRSR